LGAVAVTETMFAQLGSRDSYFMRGIVSLTGIWFKLTVIEEFRHKTPDTIMRPCFTAVMLNDTSEVMEKLVPTINVVSRTNGAVVVELVM